MVNVSGFNKKKNNNNNNLSLHTLKVKCNFLGINLIKILLYNIIKIFLCINDFRVQYKIFDNLFQWLQILLFRFIILIILLYSVANSF